jgi:hypothetical protein
MLCSQLSLSLLIGLLSSQLLTKTDNEVFIDLSRATYPFHLILFDFINLITLVELYKLPSSSSEHFLDFPLLYTLIGSVILIITLLPVIFTAYSYEHVSDRASYTTLM